MGFSPDGISRRYWHPVPVVLIVVHSTAVAFAMIRPVKPFIVAVIAVEPIAGPEVATPVLVIVATAVAFDFQVTSFVMSRVVAGWFPCWKVPIAVNCADNPGAPKYSAVGVILIETKLGLLQPISDSPRPRSKEPFK
jgi:hypothetical protein